MEDLLNFDMHKFLESCQISSNQAYENLKVFLNWLEDSSTRSQARILLSEIEEYLNNSYSEVESMQTYFFSIDKLTLDAQENEANSLTLLQLPSIFIPEDWSFTFYEGLLRRSEEEFYQRTLAELGCGNGWISIALAQRSSPSLIYGFDINPRAITCAKINLYLNAMNAKGELIRDSKGKSLLDKVQFHVSDLLAYCIDNKINLDKVIGCIPQVLSPNENIIQSIIPENSSDEALYALSNYCSKQGYVEDQFGLGLVARAIEESIQTLKPNGKVLFNLGGRPGQAVLSRLFSRRGFITQIIWQTKIEQASDTDILPLVEIEKKSSHRFEFFMGQHTKESISARTAYAYGAAGGKIFHSLNVVEADLKDALKMKIIMQLLKKEEYSNARSALDLAYDSHSLVSEKVGFLWKLAERLQSSECFPYEGVTGAKTLRSRIAEFFRVYWMCPISAKNVFIAPSRNEIIKNFISIYGVKLALVDSDLCKYLPIEMLQSDPLDRVLETPDVQKNVVVEIPKHCHSICELIEKLKPELVVCCLHHDEIQNQDSLLRLIDVSKKNNAKLIFDFSDHFDLSSVQKSNGLIEFLSENNLPKHVTLICGLIYNKIFNDMDLAFLLSENANVLSYLANAAELTYSRPSILTQEYYDTILYQLLNFHVRNQKRDKNFAIRSLLMELSSESEYNLKICEQTKIAFADPALESTKFLINKNTVRLDYGENALCAPTFLKSIVMESFCRQNISENETYSEDQIAKYLSQKYGLSFLASHITLGNGVSPIFSSISKFCGKNSISILFPTGAYGYFIAAAKFNGAKVERIETKEEFLFKFNVNDLEKYFKDNSAEKYALYFNAPVVNPMGQIYSNEEVNQIFTLCKKYNVLIILDTIFSGLEFSHAKTSHILLPYLKNCVILGGFSKEYAAAGLRFGYAYIDNLNLLKFVQKDNLNLIPTTLKYTAKKVFTLMNEDNIEVRKHIFAQKNKLNERAYKLSKTLRENGWEPMNGVGGLFLVAKPTLLIGKKIKINEENSVVEINYDNIHEVLFKVTGLLINGSKWCGIPNYCRFVLSVSDNEFTEACERLKRFFLFL